MGKLQWLGAALGLAGALLILVSVAVFLWARGGGAGLPAGAPTVPAPVATAAGPASPAPLALNPTAAAAATRLPTVAPLPTAMAAPARAGAPVRVVVERLGIDVPVVEVGWRLAEGDESRGVWDTVAGAAGHHRGSADPGREGNCVLSGHSSPEGGAVFRGLEELAAGDRVEVHTAEGQSYVYTVTQVLLLDELSATPGQPDCPGGLRQLMCTWR